MQLFTLADHQSTSPEGFTKRVFKRSPRELTFTLNFEPGQTLPAHTHGDSELLLSVLQGTGEATVDGKKVPLGGGTLLHCEGAETFSVENNGPGPLSVLVVLCPGEPKFGTDVR